MAFLRFFRLLICVFCILLANGVQRAYGAPVHYSATLSPAIYQHFDCEYNTNFTNRYKGPHCCGAAEDIISQSQCDNYIRCVFEKVFGFFPNFYGGDWGVEEAYYDVCYKDSCNPVDDYDYDEGYNHPMHDWYTMMDLEAIYDPDATLASQKCTAKLELYCYTGSNYNDGFRTYQSGVIQALARYGYTNSGVQTYLKNIDLALHSTFNFNKIMLSQLTRTPTAAYYPTIGSTEQISAFLKTVPIYWRVWYDPFSREYNKNGINRKLSELLEITYDSTKGLDFEGYFTEKYPGQDPVYETDKYGRRYYTMHKDKDTKLYSNNWPGIGPYDDPECIDWYTDVDTTKKIPPKCGGAFNTFIKYLSYIPGMRLAIIPLLSARCIQCYPGQYAKNTVTTSFWLSTCQTCAAGTYSNAVGRSSCTTCPAGTYSNSSRTGYFSCKDETKVGIDNSIYKQITSATGSSSISQCYVPAGNEVNFTDEYGSGTALLETTCYASP